MSKGYTFDDRTLIDCGDYTYVDHAVDAIKRSQNATRDPEPIEVGVLLSIHMQSNNPENFTQFLDDLEAVTKDPANVEVVIKIDDVDQPMNDLLPKEVARRPFVIRYLSTPLDGGFFELWRSMNDMLKVCNPHAYFLWNMNDEMAILNKDWDVMLAKYVGLFPDHLFRLRTSLFRFRNYYDFWENGFAPETSAITTKRWIETCGDWNPCLGPDSFNQCVSFYFGYHDRFHKHKILRDVPIHDFVLAGEGAFVGLEGDALWRRMKGATKSWFRLMSPKIQEEASRRAQKLHATIMGYDEGLGSFEVKDNKITRSIILIDSENNTTICKFPYGLSRLRISLTNIWRSFRYFYYAGGGEVERRKGFQRFITFLLLRYDSIDFGRKVYLKFRDILAAPKSKLLNIYHRIRSPGGILTQSSGPGGIRRFFFKGTHYLVRMVLLKGSNPAIRVHESVYVYDEVDQSIEWDRLQHLLSHVTWPRKLSNGNIRMQLLRCLVLKHLHRLETQELLHLVGRDLAMQRFARLPMNQAIPSVDLLEKFEATLEEHEVLEPILHQSSLYTDMDQLPNVTAQNIVAA